MTPPAGRRIAENFYNGLKTHVKDEVHQRGKPTTLEEMIALAVVVDNRLMERKMERDVDLWRTAPHVRQHRLENGLYLYCDKAGHIKRDCPSRPPRPTRKIGATTTPGAPTTSPVPGTSAGNDQPRD
ncbi:hypothetical protein OC835_007504 [Tilletia horrida]|nr:hypothetical protein OC835_007504 [Tilletia horrida]